MFIAKVTGTVVATKKDPRLVGKKLLVISPLVGQNYSRDSFKVAVDSVGAGIGEVVLVVEGSSARKVADALDSPIDATIVGIVDVMEINRQEAFYREETLSQ